MPHILHPTDLHVVTVDAESDVMPDPKAHARAGLVLFREQAEHTDLRCAGCDAI